MIYYTRYVTVQPLRHKGTEKGVVELLHISFVPLCLSGYIIAFVLILGKGRGF